MARQRYTQSFTGEMNTVVAPELMRPDQYTYMLNCDVLSTSEGKVGRVTNLRGNVSVDISLPEGDNITIGSIRDDESNRMFFAVWNSLGYHSWYQFDYISLTTKVVMQCIVDTGGVDIWKWEKGVIINSINIVNNNLLYWTMDGQPARKINIQKATDKSFDNGYGNVILDEYTRAYKKSPAFAPTAEYFTNLDLNKNNLFRKLFQWAVRFIYDDNEYSTFSDFSTVAVPEEENVTGTLGVPSQNNGLYVRFPTGGMLVRKIELIMRSTTDIKDVNSPWVSVAVFDKNLLGISNNSEYTYEFYNDNTYLSIDNAVVNQQQSDMPDFPKVQDFTYNTLVYGNFKDGFDPVKIDIDFNVEYSDLFVPDGHANVLNNPSFIINHIDHEYESGFLGGWRKTEAEVVIGPDVKSGNKFFLQFTNDDFVKEIKANLNDDASSIASKFRTELANHPRTKDKGGYVGSVTVDGSGFAKFRFKIWNNWNKNYIGFITSVTPVNYSTLKDTGNSVPNEKLGSSRRYAVRYENEDGKRSLAYGNNEIVSVLTINDLGVIKKVTTVLTIKHKAPYWATRYSIVATKDLSRNDFIQVLVQRISTASTLNGEEYQDLVIGSLFAYQKVHPNTTLSYEFKKGDRVRLLKEYDGTSWSVPANVIEYEVLNYYDEIPTTINGDIKIDGTANVEVDNPDTNNIGNSILINGQERVITGVSGTGYSLDAPITIDNAASGSEVTYPSYQIIVRGGVLRVKMNPSYPIDVDPSSGEFALIEVYAPAQSFENPENENYYDTGYKFEIVQSNGQYLHRGNAQDQTDTLPAVVRIEGFDNYVRNRDLITNTSDTNPQSIITSIEDKAYSDFYQSRLSSLGRPTRIDDSRGVIHFEDRLIWSNNFIEDTKINGLNMFLSTNRVDYNDKYGSIQKIIFYEGKLYIFKYLKTGWVPVLGNLIIDSEGNELVGTSTRLLPDKMEYFLWEGGVGDNPESIIKTGNDIFGVSPDSQVIFTIGGAGLIPTSKIYDIDNYARKIINSATLAKAKMFGGINRKKNQYFLMIQPHDVIAYKDSFSLSNTLIVPVIQEGNWIITSPPDNGTVSLGLETALYSPDLNFSGMDYFSYQAGSGVVRNVCINVLSVDVQLSWIPSGQYCVTSGGTRTGSVGYSLLLEYDNISESYTGNQKNNTIGDPDYVAPFLDVNTCPIGLEFTRLAVLSAEKGNQSIVFTVSSSDDFNIQVRSGQTFTGSLIDETGEVSSGTYTLDIPVGVGEYSVFLIVPSLNYDGVSEFRMKNAYIKSAQFNDLPELISLELDQSSIPLSHNIVFNYLDISQNIDLTELKIVHHKLSSVDLTLNQFIGKLNLSYGENLSVLSNVNWANIYELRIHECAFTKSGYTTSFINSVITSFESVVPDPSIGYTLQYGLNDLSGIRPSSAVTSAYNSLLSKGVDVIGLSPVPLISNITFDASLRDIDQNVITTVTLEYPLAASFTVYYTVDVRAFSGGPIIASENVSLVFAIGDTVKSDFIPRTWAEPFVTIINAITISPASPGGTTLFIINNNP